MRKIIEKFNTKKIKRITSPNKKHLVKYFLLFILLIFVIPQEANASFTAAAIALGWLSIKVAGVVTAAYATGHIGFKALGVYRMVDDLPDGVGGWIVGILEVLLATAERLADFAGYIFEMSIELAINIFLPVILDSSWVQAAWVAFRDLANIFFIFILLYIAIGTILQLTQVDAKRMLTKVIIIALIINFSGFFTKIVIDATNVLAYDFLQTVRGETTNQKFLSTRIRHVSTGNQEVYGLTQEENPLGGEFGPVYSRVMSIIFLLFAYILQIWVFIAGSILFFVRSMVLVFLYILSPMAFFAMMIPGQERYFSEWWHKLTTNALVAPVFMFFIVVFINMIAAPDGISHLGTQLSSSIQAAGFPVTPLFTLTLHFASFFIAYGILIGGMIASVKMGAVGAKVSALAGAAVTGYAVAQAGRQTLGRAGGALAQSETLQKMSKKKGVGGALARTGLRSSDWMSKRSFDIRNTPGGVTQQLAGTAGLDIGKATGTGGFKKSTEDKEKRKVEKQEEFMKMTGMDEAEKKEYLETNIPERFKRKVTDNIPILGRKNAKERARVREQMIGGTMSESEQEEKVQNTEAKYDQQINKVKTEGNYEAKKERWERKKEETNPELLEQRDKLKQNETKAAEAEREATEAEERGDSTKALRKRNDAGSWKYAAEQNKQTIDRLLKEREEARKAFADIEDDIGRLEKSKDIEIKNIKKGGGKKKTDMDKLAEKIKEVISSEETPASTGTTIRETLNEASVPRPQNDEELTERFKNI